MQTKGNVLFGESFFDDYAVSLITHPDIALIELVANSWDAGASNVNISWPTEVDGEFKIEDDGIGMTSKEFNERWQTLNYNRIKQQGKEVVFPPGVDKKRTAYGYNGKGRHGMFCFNNEYYIETWRDGKSTKYHVIRSNGKLPWNILKGTESGKDGHGTELSARLVNSKAYLPVNKIKELIGSKFISDPDFKVFVNRSIVDFEDLKSVAQENIVDVDKFGTVKIMKVSSTRLRTTQQHGVAYWVNSRLVGEPSWAYFEGTILDGRSSLAKRMTFIVKADILEPKEDIKADWSDLNKNEKTDALQKIVSENILQSIHNEILLDKREIKRTILTKNRQIIRRLPIISKEKIVKFIDDVQINCPTLNDEILRSVSNALIKLESCHSKYDLILKLSKLSPDDFDGLNKLLDEWSVEDAKTVLDELGNRLNLIKKLEELVEKPEVDELLQLQPLFEIGLWIFGPEFEDISFRSNKSISTIIRDYFKVNIIENTRLRPDFVILPDSSIGLYSSDYYDEKSGEVSGISKIVIIELKRGGFKITTKETDQAKNYAREIMRSGKIRRETPIIVYVLGAELNEDSRDEQTEGNIEIIPRTYSTILRQAHARTFHLHEKLRAAYNFEQDQDLKEVLAQEELF